MRPRHEGHDDVATKDTMTTKRRSLNVFVIFVA